MLNRLQVCLGVATLGLAFTATTAPTFAQTSEYYLHTGDQNTFIVIQNGAIVRQWRPPADTDQYQYPMAVRDTIRTMGANEGTIGGEYDLNGGDLGPRYTHPVGPSRSWDGATDGTNFYSIDTGGDIYRYDDDWSNPVFLFSVAGLGSLTYDPANDSLWVGLFSSSTNITEYSMSGTVLNSFSTGHTQNMALALDPADDTLWLHDRNSQGTYENWTKGGTLLSRTAVPGMSGFNCLSGEFQFGGAADCLTLTVDALVAGRRACWNVSGATPGEEVAIVYGFSPGSTVVNGLFSYCATFGIQGVNTNKVICRKDADGAGNVQCCKTIPGGAGGTRVLSQAAERNTCPDECVSNVDDQIVG